MNRSRRHVALKRLLDLCDHLHRIRHKLADPELRRDAQLRLRRQSKSKAEQIARQLGSYRFRGPLAEVMSEFKLRVEHFQILAILLQRHMRSEDPTLEGRLILGSIFDTSFDVLAGMELLHESGALRRAGLIVLDDAEQETPDLLESRFRVSDEALESFRAESAAFVPEDLRKSSQDRYANHRELLVDLRILHNLYKHRSERVFHEDRWDRVHVGHVVPGAGLTRRIERFWNRIRQRLEHSDDAPTFPTVRFMREYELGELELVMVIHLLFQELYEGTAHADVAELLKLVSASEDELIKNRRLVIAPRCLVKHEILHIEPMLEGRELTGEAHLNDWVVNELFGTFAHERAIEPDERLNWHLYLKELGDSGKFFTDLEKN